MGVLFARVSWGTSEVLASTLSNAQQAHLGVGLLDTLWDVDTIDDWRRYQRWLKGGPHSG